jgi:hypothetical protein
METKKLTKKQKEEAELYARCKQIVNWANEIVCKENEYEVEVKLVKAGVMGEPSKSFSDIKIYNNHCQLVLKYNLLLSPWGFEQSIKRKNWYDFTDYYHPYRMVSATLHIDGLQFEYEFPKDFVESLYTSTIFNKLKERTMTPLELLNKKL